MSQDFQKKTIYNAVVSFKKQNQNIILFLSWDMSNFLKHIDLILPCFDRISSNFPIAKERKTRNGRGANPDQGQGQDLEAGREVGPDQDPQIDTEEGNICS